MAAYVIRTIPNVSKRTLYYNSCGAPEWQPGFPEIFSSKDRVNSTFIELKKRWKEIEIFNLENELKQV